MLTEYTLSIRSPDRRYPSAEALSSVLSRAFPRHAVSVEAPLVTEVIKRPRRLSRHIRDALLVDGKTHASRGLTSMGRMVTLAEMELQGVPLTSKDLWTNLVIGTDHDPDMEGSIVAAPKVDKDLYNVLYPIDDPVKLTRHPVYRPLPAYLIHRKSEKGMTRYAQKRSELRQRYPVPLANCMAAYPGFRDFLRGMQDSGLVERAPETEAERKARYARFVARWTDKKEFDPTWRAGVQRSELFQITALGREMLDTYYVHDFWTDNPNVTEGETFRGLDLNDVHALCRREGDWLSVLTHEPHFLRYRGLFSTYKRAQRRAMMAPDRRRLLGPLMDATHYNLEQL